MTYRYDMVVILGPTAAGKTRLAARLARDRGGEIISADSRQVYRGMDLGTGKDLSDYIVDSVTVPVHLLDVADPQDEFNLFDYQRLCYRALAAIAARGALPVMTGGSGMYLEAVICAYDLPAAPENPALRRELAVLDMEELAGRLRDLQPDLHNKTDLLDRDRLIRAIEIVMAAGKKEGNAVAGERHDDRPNVHPLIVGLHWERDVLRRRITERLHARLAAGMVEEVAALHSGGVSWERLDRFGLEYRYIGLYLQGRLDYQEMVRTLNIRIHQFAKRQATWFRRMERQGVTIHWLTGDDYAALQALTDRYLG